MNDNKSTKSAEALPELPKPYYRDVGHTQVPWYSPEQMRAAILADRTARAVVPVSVAGLGSMTAEDDGVLTLRFIDDDAAQTFMDDYVPSVESDDMPKRAAAPVQSIGEDVAFAGLLIACAEAYPAGGAALVESTTDLIAHIDSLLAARPSAADRTTDYHRGYQAGIEMGKALAVDEAAPSAQVAVPDGGECHWCVEERN